MTEFDPRAIRGRSAGLEYSGLFAIPTETVYGLGANADDEMAVKKIFEAKGRPQNRPLSVLISGEEALDAWAKDVPQAAYTLARRFWPGPLTMILQKGERAGDWITGGQTTIGLRAPGHPRALALLRPLRVKSIAVSPRPRPIPSERFHPRAPSTSWTISVRNRAVKSI